VVGNTSAGEDEDASGSFGWVLRGRAGRQGRFPVAPFFVDAEEEKRMGRGSGLMHREEKKGVLACRSTCGAAVEGVPAASNGLVRWRRAPVGEAGDRWGGQHRKEVVACVPQWL
jgi:hypothetical protein